MGGGNSPVCTQDEKQKPWMHNLRFKSFSDAKTKQTQIKQQRPTILITFWTMLQVHFCGSVGNAFKQLYTGRMCSNKIDRKEYDGQTD